MRVAEFRYTPVELPLRRPLRTARGEIRKRSGFLVAAKSETGVTGLGEIVILPEFGTESFFAADSFLSTLVEDERTFEIPEAAGRFPEWHRQVDLTSAALPATAFGIDCALHSLQKALERDARPLHRQFVVPARSVSVNALIGGGSADEIYDAAVRERNAGMRTVKLKVGVLPPEEEIRIVRRIRLGLPDLRLRLDANCAWDVETAIEFCSRVEPFGIEFIEDPIHEGELSKYEKLRKCCEIRIAFDESWSMSQMLGDSFSWPLCDVLIVKPSRVGSMFHVQSICTLARERGKQAVFTGMYDSSIGIAAALGFLHSFADHRIAHGYGTATLLEKDTMTARMIPIRGELPLIDTAMLAQLIEEPYRSRLGISR